MHASLIVNWGVVQGKETLPVYPLDNTKQVEPTRSSNRLSDVAPQGDGDRMTDAFGDKKVRLLTPMTPATFGLSHLRDPLARSK